MLISVLAACTHKDRNGVIKTPSSSLTSAASASRISTPAATQATPPTTTSATTPVKSSTPVAPTTTTAPTRSKLDVATTFKVQFQIPADWTPTPHNEMGGFNQDGPTGWVVVNAAQAPTLSSVCQTQAEHQLHPFGSTPTITTGTVANRPACFVTPSADAPATSVRVNGPRFQSAMFAVQYRTPISGGYTYLVITCDPAHLQSIASSVQMLNGY